MKTIIRISYNPVLTHLDVRNQVLRRHFGKDVEFVVWAPPDNPGHLFDALREQIEQKNAVAVELGTSDRFLAALLAVGVSMTAFHIPVAGPTVGLTSVPILTPVIENDTLTGYAELTDATPVAIVRLDIIT